MNVYRSLIAALGIFSILLIIPAIVIIIGTWKMYEKAGRKGWESIIPFYSYYILATEIANLNWYWFILLILESLANFTEKEAFIITLAGILGRVVCNYNIAKKLKLTNTFTVLATLFPGIAYAVIGFSSKYEFDNTVPLSGNGPFDSSNTTNNKTNNNTNNNAAGNTSYCPNCGSKVNEGEKFCGNCGKEVK